MNRFNRLVATLLLLLSLAPAVQAAVRASLDRTEVIEGDPVILTIRQDGPGTGSRPDLGPLERDFVVEGSSQGSQIRIVNGARSESTYWSVRMTPKRTGTLQVPALQVGSERTDPIPLKVNPVPAPGSAGPDRPVLVELEADLPSGGSFVQQQIPVTVRLLYRDRLQGGTLSDPAPEHAVVERLGDDRRYRTVRNGLEYNVIERHYAIFPEQSGPLRIPPVVFRGRIASADSGTGGRRRGDLFDRFLQGTPFANDPFFRQNDFFGGTPFGNPGEPVRARSRDLTLQVAPRPAGYSGQHWLPAEAVVLEDSWSRSPPRFRVGEPVTRTITLQAKGLEASQIPPLELPQADGFRLYADQPVNETRTDGNGVYGISRRTFTYVPRREGRLTIPEYRLQWWNTLSGSQDQTLLPQWQVDVLPGSGPSQPQQAPLATPAGQGGQQPSTRVTEGAEPGFLARHWPWLLALVLAAMLLAWVLVRRRSARPAEGDRPEAPAEEKPAPPRRALARARSELRSACEGNDARAAAGALLALAEALWPEDPPRNLEALARRLPEAGGQIRELERALYAPVDLHWDGGPLWQVARKATGSDGDGATGEPAEAVPPLYPD